MGPGHVIENRLIVNHLLENYLLEKSFDRKSFDRKKILAQPFPLLFNSPDRHFDQHFYRNLNL